MPWKECSVEEERMRFVVRLGYGNQLPAQIETAIVRFKREKPHWGARKIREMLVRQIESGGRYRI